MSGLYTAIFGINPDYERLLEIINLRAEQIDRFRDIYVQPMGDIIVVHTRTGGGNRETHKENIGFLRKHPLYATDRDSSYDTTYANFYFWVPDEHIEECKRMAKKKPFTTPEDKWKENIKKLETKEGAEEAANIFSKAVDNGHIKISKGVSSEGVEFISILDKN